MLGFLKKLLGGASVNYKGLVTNGAIIVDVRSASEYKAGHIPGSKNFPLDSIRTKLTELKKTMTENGIEPKPIIVQPLTAIVFKF